MDAEPHNVIVTDNSCNTCGTDTILVHHQNFPEMRISGSSAAEAARLLFERLSSEIDAVSDPIHREPVVQAIEDLRSFIERSRRAGSPSEL
jgi:hypothetical protein